MVAGAPHRSLSGRNMRHVLPLVLALVASALVVPAVSAGVEAPPEITFRILKLDCEEDPGQVPDGLTPEGCAPAEGVSFTIEIEGGETLECTTDAEGRCSVQVPSESMVTVTEDESTGSDGYTPRENPIETQAVTEFAGAIFVNVLDDAPEPEPEPEPSEEPTTGLPETGTGTTAMGAPSSGLLPAIVSLLALTGAVALVAAPRLRRR